MGQHHPLGAARAARGVLKKGGITGLRPMRRIVRARLPQPIGGHDAAQTHHHGLEQAADVQGLGYRDKDRSQRVGHDPRVAHQVVLDLGEPRRRIDGDRNAARQQHPEEAEEIITAGGQHQGHALPRLQSFGDQPRCDRPGAVHEPLVAYLGGLILLLLVKIDVDPLTMGLYVPGKHILQRLRVPRHLRGHLPRQGGNPNPI